MTNIHQSEGLGENPTPLSEDRLLYLGGLMGLTPSFRAGHSGQPLARAAAEADLTREVAAPTHHLRSLAGKVISFLTNDYYKSNPQ